MKSWTSSILMVGVVSCSFLFNCLSSALRVLFSCCKLLISVLSSLLSSSGSINLVLTIDMSCLNLLSRVSSFASILGIFSTFIEMFLSFSVISEINWFKVVDSCQVSVRCIFKG